MDLNDIASDLRARFDAKTKAREEGLARSRNTIRSCGNAIRALHRYEIDAASTLLDEAQEQLDGARAALKDHPDLLHGGFVHDAEKEVAEARITFALVTDSEFPTLEALGVAEAAYVKGLAEAIVAKHRNGPIDKVKLAFLSHLTQFRDYHPAP